MERWRFLEPWCVHLRGRVTLETTSSSDTFCSMRSRYSRLCVALPPDGKGTNWKLIQELREAVELLGAIARVDNAAFRELLALKCGVSALLGTSTAGGDHSRTLLDEEPLAPRFSFVFYQYNNLEVSWGSTLYNQFFLALDYESLSDAFRDALAQMHQRVAEYGDSTMLTEKIPVAISFKPPELPSHWSLPYLKSVLEIVQAIQDEFECSTSGGDHPFPFLLEAVSLNVNHVTLDKKTLVILKELLALGVKIPLLSLHDSMVIAKAPRNYMGDFITAMTRCSVKNEASDEGGFADTDFQDSPLSPPQASDTFRLRGPGVDSHQFGAFCSALASSKGIASVYLSEMFTEERGYQRFIKWQWTAYAFFWRDSSLSDISSLHIADTKLTDEDVIAIASVVNAKYPAKSLLRVEDATSDPEDEENEDPVNGGNQQANSKILSLSKDKEQDVISVLLNKGAEIKIDPYDPCGRASFELSADDHFLVMKDDESSDYVEILVPGYAHCAVARDAVQYYLCNSEAEQILEPSSLQSRASFSSITTLRAEFKHVVQPNTLQAFITLVGAPLLSLVLKVGGMSSESLDVILRTCTKLKRLSLDIIEENTLSVLARAYEEGSRGCQVSSLSLEGLELESEEISVFVQALGNKSTKMGKTLVELSVGERLESYALDEANLFALLAMLETNNKLEYLELYVEHTLYDNFLPLFNEFHGQELPVIKQQMALACRLAFLSVLTATTFLPEVVTNDGNQGADEEMACEERAPKRARCQSSASLSSSSTGAADTSRLDRHVIALIFQFAAIPKQRVVNLIKFH
ncbi:hypothetical protein Gpo141_00010938 [Globisporangium polare]